MLEIGYINLLTWCKHALQAELPDQTVAVKLLSSQSKHVIDQIGTEVYALKTLKHENIVEFLDGYSKKDLNLLIYEYMEKGSLERALFGKPIYIYFHHHFISINFSV